MAMHQLISYLFSLSTFIISLCYFEIFIQKQRWMKKIDHKTTNRQGGIVLIQLLKLEKSLRLILFKFYFVLSFIY